jgi:hypothetical protein
LEVSESNELVIMSHVSCPAWLEVRKSNEAQRVSCAGWLEVGKSNEAVKVIHGQSRLLLGLSDGQIGRIPAVPSPQVEKTNDHSHKHTRGVCESKWDRRPLDLSGLVFRFR